MSNRIVIWNRKVPSCRRAAGDRSRSAMAARGATAAGPEAVLEDADLGVVADHEAECAGLAVAAADRDVAPEQRGLHAPAEVGDGAAVEQDRVLDLGALD